MKAAWNIIKDDFDIPKKEKNILDKENYSNDILRYFANCQDRKTLKKKVLKLIDNDFQIRQIDKENN